MNDVLETGTQQTNSLVVDMVSDLICPWCFVAKRRVEKAAAILGEKVEMHWLPFELNADMPVDGLDRRVYRLAKFGSWEIAYMYRDGDGVAQDDALAFF